MNDTGTRRATLSVAIVGCGVIGRTHAEVLGVLPGFEVTALIDGRTDIAAELADSIENRGGLRPRIFDSLPAALESDEPIELVVIATPSGLHVEQAIAALESGKHVVIEKPLDVQVGRARQLTVAAAAAAVRGQLCTVISQHRFDPASRVIREAIEQGRFGRLTSAIASVSWWRSQGYYDSGAWRGTWALDGGGALMNQGVHTVDLLLWFLGRPVAVSAEFGLLAHENLEVEDTAVATLTFENGALAVLHATTAAYPGLTVRLQVMGSAGSAILDHDELEYFHAAEQGAASDMGLQGAGNQAHDQDLTDRGPATVLTGKGPVGHARQYADIREAILEGRPPLVTVDDALLALATVRAVYLAAASGEKVRIDDVLAGEGGDGPLPVPTPDASVV